MVSCCQHTPPVRRPGRVRTCLPASLPAARSTSPERERPGLPLSPSKRRAGSGSVAISGTLGSGRAEGSPTKRGGGGRGGMFRTRSVGGGAADPGALPAALATGLIAPPLPRADWPLVTPVTILK